MSTWDTPNDVNGATLLIALQHQYRWPLGKLRVILDDHCMTDAEEYIANRNVVLDQPIIAVLGDACFSRGDKGNNGFQGCIHDLPPKDPAANEIASILKAFPEGSEAAESSQVD